MIARLGICAAFTIALSSCSPPNRLYDTVPFPTLTTMTCTLHAVHTGVLNPTYYGERATGSMTLVFRDLDPEAHMATIVGNNSSVPVEFRAAPTQMQFIETTAMGSLTATTVFSPPMAGKPMPAVHSRHIMVAPANVSISQFAGECTAA